MSFIFFIAAVPKTANASNSGVQALFIFMLSVALYSRQCSSMAATLFFYF
jgi:hypothetical protein